MSEEGESQIQFPVGAQGTTLSPVLGDATLQLASASHSQQTKRKRQRMLLGLMLLGLVVFLWVSSSELIQFIFQNLTFNKPFFLTYLSTSSFSLYILGFLLSPWWRRTCSQGAGTGYQQHEDPAPTESGGANSVREEGMEEDSLDGHSSSSLDPLRGVAITQADHRPQPLSFASVLRIAAIMCPLWFLANVSFNASLSMTSVSSNTILSTTSGLFTFLLGIFFLRDKFHLAKLLALLISFGGVVMISLADASSSSEDGHEGVLGDLLSLFGALMYATYTVVMRVLIPEDDSRVSMFMLFGIMGVVNIVCLWPFFFVLHFSGVEPFELPHGSTLGALLLNALVGTALSDVLWALSVLLTNPVIATVGLSLTIPVAMLADLLLGKTHFQVLYLLGMALVFGGFLLINWIYYTLDRRKVPPVTENEPR